MIGPLLSLVLAVSPLAGVQREVLPNGLTVLLLEDHSAPLVTVGTMYRAGAKNERPGITGIAHYVEHMAFRALEGFPGSESTESITRIGGRWNGYTWIDQTWYAETVPKQALDRMLELEARRMTGALFTSEDFKKERTSVIAELQSYDDPHSLLYDAVLAASFEIHPYRYNTIGWISDVLAITRDEAYGFYRRYYHPENAVLVVVGDMDASRTLAGIRERFSALPRGRASAAVRTVEPPQEGERRVAVRQPGPHAEVLVAWRAPALREADFPTMVLLDALLAGGKGLRFLTDYPVPAGTPLQQATVEAGLASEAGSAWQASVYPYVYTLRATAPTGADLGRLEKALLGVVDAGAHRDWTRSGIQAAIRQVRRGISRDLDGQAGKAHQLAFFEVSGGYQYLMDMLDRLGSVSVEDLQRFARERLGRDRATVGWFVPTPDAPSLLASGRAAAVPGPGPASVPAAGPGAPAGPPVRPAAPRTIRLHNGLEVVLAPRPGATLVALRARVDAGSLYDGATPGLSALATAHLAAAASGASGPGTVFTLREDPTSFANARWIELGASGLPDELDQMLRSAAGRLQAPPPAGEAFEALRGEVAQRAGELADRAEPVAWARALARLYPAGSALSSPAWGAPDVIGRIRAEELAAFLAHHVTPDRTRLVLAGALEPAAAQAAVEAAFGGWRGTGRARPSAAAPPRGPAEWTEVRIARPQAQDDIAIFWPGDRTKPADADATRALLYLLGETYYAGRLGRALVEPGLVYSVWTTLEEDGSPGFLEVHTAAAPRDTPEVLARIRAILERAASGTFSQAELDEAKAYLRGKAARQRDGSEVEAAALLRRASGVPAGPVPELDLSELNDAARRLFARGAPLAIVVGPEP